MKSLSSDIQYNCNELKTTRAIVKERKILQIYNYYKWNRFVVCIKMVHNIISVDIRIIEKKLNCIILLLGILLYTNYRGL